MIFRNPCKKCLVRACCGELCNDKKKFIDNHAKCANAIFGSIPVTIALLTLLTHIIIMSINF